MPGAGGHGDGDNANAHLIVPMGNADHISDLPDECLAYIFKSLSSHDRKSSSLVCRRWFLVEGQYRHRLTIFHVIPSLFTRFDALTTLTLKNIGDDDVNSLVPISLHCPNLTSLILHACHGLSDGDITTFAANSKGLKKLSCQSCNFGAEAMNAIVNHCSSLEELSVKRLRGLNNNSTAIPIGPGVAAFSLKTICLDGIRNGQCFKPLIMGSKNLKTLKLFRCLGDNWDKFLVDIVERVTGLVEIYLEIILSDVGLAAISNCSNLKTLHIVMVPHCTNLGLVSIADRCKLLQELHIYQWEKDKIDDDSLIAITKRCPNLVELVLVDVSLTSLSLSQLAANCRKLERLALCGGDTVGDAEISCIAAQCMSLKYLSIIECPVTDHGMELLSGGCPNLIKVKLWNCKGVTSVGVARLRGCRGSLAVNLVAAQDDNVDANRGYWLPYPRWYWSRLILIRNRSSNNGLFRLGIRLNLKTQSLFSRNN